MLSAALALSLAMANPPDEALRPQFHFTAPKGWLNDPNGLVFYKGEYHLFYQHNPFGTNWGNMTWGHAVSKDLLSWSDLANAIEPDETGTMFSGSAVVDSANSSGLGTRTNPPLVLLYTAAGGTNEASKGVNFTQRLAYSTDGRKFEKLKAKPVVPFIEHENRDPKVFWHEKSKSWIMALYINDDRFALFRSSDLTTWTKSDDVRVQGSSECPDFFELHVFGAPGVDKWVFWTANGRYLLGTFDGFKFKPEGEPIASNFGEHDYAAQTFSDEPKKRRVQISWMRGGTYPGMPFNQQMTLPRELRLRQTPFGPRLSFSPVKELESIRDKLVFDVARVQGEVEVPTASELVEVRAEFRRDRDAKFMFAGKTVEYRASERKLYCMGKVAALPGKSRTCDIILYFDRTSLEVFADEGLVSMPFCFVPGAFPKVFKMETPENRIEQLRIWTLRPAIKR